MKKELKKQPEDNSIKWLRNECYNLYHYKIKECKYDIEVIDAIEDFVLKSIKIYEVSNEKST